MRILAVGSFFVPYIHDNWRDPLRYLYGDDVVFVNAGPFLARFDIGYLEQYLYALIRRDRFDFLFFYPDWIYSDFEDRFFDRVRALGLRVVTFLPDDEPELWYRKNLRFDHRFDLVASHSAAGVRRRAEAGRAGHFLHLPWGYNPRRFAPPDAPWRKDYDIVFIGRHKVYAHDEGGHHEDGLDREAVLRLIAERSRERGWRFGLFGYGWERHPLLGEFAGGPLSHAAMVDLFHRSKIVFNPAWSRDPGVSAPQTKLRHFEVAGCGAFQVTNRNPELAELLAPGREVVFYDDDDALVEILEYFIGADEERERIAAAGQRRALAEHTMDHRLRALFSAARRLWPVIGPVAADGGGAIRVRRYPLADREEARSLLARLERGDEVLDGVELVHYLDTAFTAASPDYGALRPWLARPALGLFGVRAHLEVLGCEENPVQPTRQESRGDFVAEVIDWDALSRANRRRLRRSALLIDGEVEGRLISNYLARPPRAAALLRAFVEGSAAQLDRLGPFHTGVVVNELTVTAEPDEVSLRGPVYLAPLRALLAKAAREGRRVMVYGGRGEMAQWAISAARETPRLALVAIVDNGMDGGRIGEVEVIGAAAVEGMRPDLIVIAALHSGPAIHATLLPLEGRATIVPLYDLSAPVWAVQLP